MILDICVRERRVKQRHTREKMKRNAQCNHLFRLAFTHTDYNTHKMCPTNFIQKNHYFSKLIKLKLGRVVPLML